MDARDAPTRPEATGRRQRYTLDERFEHLREIARGGMGRVVEARDRHLGRIVAVKESLDDHPDSLLRFEREVAITARLEHPSIVPVYDAGVASDGTPFYVMRRVTGAPLDRLIDKAGTLGKRLALLPHVLAVSDAIAHAHQRGVIHRDVKPSNVLVGELGETVVIDWGLAKMLDDDELPGTVVRERGLLETQAGAIIGTPGFMAPEQVTGGASDARSDVYAIGACLYYLLAGRTPFHGSTEEEVLERTRTGALDALGDVPEELATIVRIAMATDPAKRYLDAGGLSEDLRRFLAGQLVASHRYSLGQRAARWLSRHRTVAVAVIGLAIAATVATVLVRRLGAEQARGATKADDIVIVQATELVAEDPTRAIAILKQLRPDSPRWASLGPVLAEARARGIADGYPGHTHFDQLRFNADPNDRRVLSAGYGILRVTDLAARTSTVVAEGPHSMRAWWCGALVMFTPAPGTLRLVDARTRATHDIAWPHEAIAAAAAHGLVAFVDDQHRVVTLDVPSLPVTAEPVIVAAASEANYVELSPTGHWMVVYRATSTLVFERAGGWRLAFEIPHVIAQLEFSDREDRIVFREDAKPQAVAELELPSGRELHRWPVMGSVDIAYVDDRVYSASAGFVVRLLDDGRPLDIGRTDSPAMFTLDRAADYLAILESSRQISLVRGSYRRTLRSPIDLQVFAADPAGRYIVGIGGGTLLAWDLAPVLPRVLPIAADSVVFRDETAIVTTKLVDVARQVDTYRFTPAFGIQAEANLGKIPVVGDLYAMPGGVTVARDVAEGIEHVFASPLETRNDITAVEMIDHETFLVGTVDGAIERVTRTGEVTRVAKLADRVATVTSAGAYTAAQTYGSEVVRFGPHGEARTKMADQMLGILATPDGTVYVASKTKLLVWRLTGGPTLATDLGNRVDAIRFVVGGRIAIATNDHSLHIYEPATQVTRLVANGNTQPPGIDLDVSEDGTLAAAKIDRGLYAVQVATGARWSLADRIDTRSIAISPGARYLIASDAGDDALYRFDTSLPPTTSAWLEAATNARPPRSSSAALEWPAP